MIHLAPLIADLALILGAAAVTTLLFRKLRQPVVLGYLIAGFLVGPHFDFLPTITEINNINIWAEIGVIFLLFSLGLEFSFKKLVKVGAPASITAVIEVTCMMTLGYLTGMLLGWNQIDSIFLGGILSISSTTIIIRAFDELGVKNQKFAGLVFGVLIVEDLVAILLLVLLTTLAVSQQFQGGEILWSLVNLLFFLSLWFLAGIFILPTVMKRVKELLSDETLLIVSVALCLLMVTLATSVGFSPALGAFVMGSILAETNKGPRIEHLLSSVKDFFGAVFFVSVGMLIDPAVLLDYSWPIVIITLVTVFGKFLSSSLGALLSGQTLKSSLQAGLSLSQIGEFSFIIATLGVTLSVTSKFLYPIAVAVSAITTFTTPYLIKYSPVIYAGLERSLSTSFKDRLTRYSTSAQTITTESDWRKVLQSFLLLLVSNSVIIIAILTLSTKYVTTFISGQFSNELVGSIIATLICLIFISPFLWALTARKINNHAYTNLWLNGKYNRGPLVLLEILRISLALSFVGYLLHKQLGGTYAFPISIILVMIVFLIFWNKLQRFYDRIESRFITNLNTNKGKQPPLVPWDTHFGFYEMNAESSWAGRRLDDLKLREQHGINISSIQRGVKIINTPSRSERLFPGDKLAVIGTDDQISSFKGALDLSVAESKNDESDESPRLIQFRVQPYSFLHGKTIRESNIREQTEGLVIGIERSAIRITNPESTEIFEPADLIYLVALEEKAKQFLEKLNVSKT